MRLAGERVRALSWNIHGCIGKDGLFNPDGVADAVRAMAPDIVALQEVDARPHVAGALDTFAFLRDELGWHVATTRTIVHNGGDYGQMLLSRWPIQEITRLDLSVPGREPRSAIVATVARHGLRIIAAHLGLTAQERRYQLEVIRRALPQIGRGPGLILGDFNEWRRSGLATRTFCPPFSVAAALPSYPARWPLVALDRIWVRPPLEAVAARVVAEARHLSDHLPVLADLRLAPRRETGG